MDKRNFIKSLGIGSMALTLPSRSSKAAAALSAIPPQKGSHRVWINPDHKDTEAQIQESYAAYKKAGIADIFFEDDSEKHFRIAKKNGIKP
jgi:hypothetical protein